ncbi:MAG: hypothetical protein GXO79_00715 [Chlorobi bacterium]|nr:hypothetical protein [Chlorobiota bacterium]
MNKEIKTKLENFENEIRTHYLNTEFENFEDFYLHNPFFLTNYETLQLEQIYEMDSTYQENMDFINDIGQY